MPSFLILHATSYRKDKLLIKEALHIQLTSKDTIMNIDKGIDLKLPGCLVNAVHVTIVHCNNTIVKITISLVSTVSRISQLVNSNYY